MSFKRLATVATIVTIALLGQPTRAQQRALAGEGGAVGLGLALRHLANAAIYLETTAHPDDENSGLDAMLNHGQGVRTTLLTVTRGTGGQNEIGPELFEALSVLRTEELAAVHRWDGTEQYFARAIDFGYSFGVEETFDKWGKDQILGDIVRMIRTIRPDVMVAMRPDGEGGGQHHQASGRLAAEAFRAAGDPARFPEQIHDGLRPWQPRKLYHSIGFGMRGAPAGVRAVSVNADTYDPLLGRTYAEIGSLARSNHKCQGMGQLLSLPGPSVAVYRLSDTTIAGQQERTESSLFDGVDTSIEGLAAFAGSRPPELLTTGLASLGRNVKAAQKAFDTQSVAATLAPLLAGLADVRSLLAGLGSLPIDEQAKFEIAYRLRTKEQQFQQAIVLAQGLRLEALADDGVVVDGQPVKVTVLVANRGTSAIELKQAALSGFSGTGACKPQGVAAGGVYRCESDVRVPTDAADSTPYWKPINGTGRYEFASDAPFGLPFRPTPFRLGVTLTVGGTEVMVDLPVLHRYEGNIFSGEKRMEIQVVPAFSVRMGADSLILPASNLRRVAAAGSPAQAGRDIRVTVTNGLKDASTAEVSLDVPAGWKVTPATAPLAFEREDEARTVRFTVAPPPTATPGAYSVHARVRSAAGIFDRGYEVIEYPHISRRHRVTPAETTVKIVDVRIPANLRVGYVMGVGDQVPPAIEQLGATVELLGPDDLAWGNLSSYDAIVTGVRAYERRADLRAYNHRLLEYAQGGGTVVVQYNKFEFNEAQYGPFPAKVSSNRVTDEAAPVRVLAPAHPIFRAPNAITDATWQGWVQERGLYFLGDKDPRYVDLVELEDPFPFNKGVKRGALVEAQVGKGHWLYVGLGLWRQLPAGTDGAYTLLANLVSLGRVARPVAPPKE